MAISDDRTAPFLDALRSRPTHGRWPWVAAALALPSSLALAALRGRLKGGAWLLWAPTPALFWHQTEEWVVPGGFLPWINRTVLGSAADEYPITRRTGFVINVVVGWGLNLASARLGLRAPFLAATVLASFAGNVALHGSAAVRQRSYNPGLGSALLLLAPTAAAGFASLARNPRAGKRDIALGAACGALLSAGMFIGLRERTAHGGGASGR